MFPLNLNAKPVCENYSAPKSFIEIEKGIARKIEIFANKHISPSLLMKSVTHLILADGEHFLKASGRLRRWANVFGQKIAYGRKNATTVRFKTAMNARKVFGGFSSLQRLFAEGLQLED